MKYPVLVFSLCIAASSMLSLNVQKALASSPSDSVQVIAFNAQAAAANASIYSWRRVSYNISHIAAAEKRIENSPMSENPVSQSLRKDVLDLRSAYVNHNVDQIESASSRVQEDCSKLIH